MGPQDGDKKGQDMKTNIASERAKLNLTQEQLANLLEVSRDSVSNWETGVVTLKADTAVRLADIFHCSVDYLLCRTEERFFTAQTND